MGLRPQPSDIAYSRRKHTGLDIIVEATSRDAPRRRKVAAVADAVAHGVSKGLVFHSIDRSPLVFGLASPRALHIAYWEYASRVVNPLRATFFRCVSASSEELRNRHRDGRSHLPPPKDSDPSFFDTECRSSSRHALRGWLCSVGRLARRGLEDLRRAALRDRDRSGAAQHEADQRRTRSHGRGGHRRSRARLVTTLSGASSLGSAGRKSLLRLSGDRRSLGTGDPSCFSAAASTRARSTSRNASQTDCPLSCLPARRLTQLGSPIRCAGHALIGRADVACRHYSVRAEMSGLTIAVGNPTLR